LVAKVGEKISVRRSTRMSSPGPLGAYLHGTRIGVLVEYEGADHGSAPVPVARGDVPVMALGTPGGVLRARELGTEIGWDRSRLSHHVSRMEERGLVSREECSEDARGTMVRLTDAGPRTIECQLRLDGGAIPWVLHKLSGLDLATLWARQLAGVKVMPKLRRALNRPMPANIAIACWVAAPNTSGELVSIDGIEASHR